MYWRFQNAQRYPHRWYSKMKQKLLRNGQPREQSMVLLLPVTSGDMFMCNSAWFGIYGKLRNKEGWWDQVPLDRCLIDTDAPYLGGEREDRIYSPLMKHLFWY